LALTSSDPLGAAVAAPPRPSAPRRPGEKYAQADVSLATRRVIAIAASEASVPIDVAGTLIAEAALLLERLDSRRVRSSASLLDRAAAASRATRALNAADADYLRALMCRSWRRHRAELDLPIRLLERLGDRIDGRVARCELLESAVRWEIAAVLSGRSMSSWGSETVLAGFRQLS
jgi:hypothetical protein